MRLGAPSSPVPASRRSDAGRGRAGLRGGSRSLGVGSGPRVAGCRRARRMCVTADRPEGPSAVGQTRKGQGRGRGGAARGFRRSGAPPPRPYPSSVPASSSCPPPPAPIQVPERGGGHCTLPGAGLGSGSCEEKDLRPVPRPLVTMDSERWLWDFSLFLSKTLLCSPCKRRVSLGDIQRRLSRITRTLCSRSGLLTAHLQRRKERVLSPASF